MGLRFAICRWPNYAVKTLYNIIGICRFHTTVYVANVNDKLCMIVLSVLLFNGIQSTCVVSSALTDYFSTVTDCVLCGVRNKF
jgi:isoprenylcysteine carboxyl methyltransferase (ICMT) family protein YpbQ